MVKQGDSKKRQGSVTLLQLREAKRNNQTCLCGNIDKLSCHVGSIQKMIKNGRICTWGGKPGAYAVCGKCKDENKKPVSLHYNLKGENGPGALCFYHYRNDCHFWFRQEQSPQFALTEEGGWEEATAKEIDVNRNHIELLSEQL